MYAYKLMFLFYKNETYLYTRFLSLARTYHLVPPSLISISGQQEEGEDANKEQEDTVYNRNLSFSHSSAILLPQEEEEEGE